MSQNLIIAVRTRPFLERDNTRKLLECPSMALEFFPDTPGYLKIRSDEYFTDKALRTKIENGELEKHMVDKHIKSFNFTHAFNSFICFDQEVADFNGIPKGKPENFAGQTDVYQAIGIPMLQKALDGFNTTVFAYGQTGSGKSYSMMGVLDDHDQWGIIPRACSELFEKIPEMKEKYESEGKKIDILIEARYIEIYNEAIRDLLCLDRDLSVYKEQKFNMDQVMAVIHDKGASDFVSNLKNQRDELNRQQLKGDSDQLKRKRQVYNKLNDNSSVNPDDLKVVTLNKIPEVMGATRVVVQSFEDINRLINIGDGLRFKRATKMNAESSRSHSIFTVTIKQFVTETVEQDGKRTEVKNVIEADMNLVDLAGSERANDTGASGAGLREGSNINRSLSHLGSVIRWLAATPNEKKKLARPSMRASKLTQMLSNALGGNCFTVMIAALSPSAVDFDQTLSTLRYAQVAAKITNVVKRNVSPLQAKVDELSKQVEEQQKLIDQLKLAANPEMVQELQEQLELAQQRLNSLDDTRVEGTEQQNSEYFAAAAQEITTTRGPITSNAAWLVNINPDPQWSGTQRYDIKEGDHLIAGKNQEIAMQGISVSDEHAVVELSEDGHIMITPNGETHVDGKLITDPTKLECGQTVVFAQRYLYRYIGQGNEGRQVSEFLSDDDYQAALDALQAERMAQMQKQFEKERLEYEAKLVRMREEAAAAIEAEKEDLRRKQQELEEQGMSEEANALNEELANVESRVNKEQEEKEAKGQQQLKNRQEQRATLESQLADVMPKINEFNAISRTILEINPEVSPRAITLKPSIAVRFDPTLNKHVSGVIIQVVEPEKTEWDVEEFTERYSIANAIWNDYADFGIINPIEDSQNPFKRIVDITKPSLLGTASLPAEIVSMGFEYETGSSIFRSDGSQAGTLNLAIQPVNEDGSNFEDDPDEFSIIGNRIFVRITIKNLRGLPATHSTAPFVNYSWWLGNKDATVIDWDKSGMNVDIEHDRIFEIVVSEEFLEYTASSDIVFEVFGHHKDAIAARERKAQLKLEPQHERDIDEEVRKLMEESSGMIENQKEEAAEDLNDKRAEEARIIAEREKEEETMKDKRIAELLLQIENDKKEKMELEERIIMENSNKRGCCNMQ
ncbi:hypothetical protein PCE1_001851 [Barthelona sp. PCE]